MTTTRDDRARTHIKALLEILKEQAPEQLAQPAGLFISGMLTGLAASLEVLDGSTAEQTMENVPTKLEAAIGRAFLNGTLPTTPPKTDPADERAQRAQAALARVRALHRPVDHYGVRICAECSQHDGVSTDNSPCEYEYCSTLLAIDGSTGPAATEATEQGTPVDWQATAEQREQELKAVGEARHKAEQERDGAYGERAHLVALLAAMTDGAVIAPAVDVAAPGWQIAYLAIGGRQASWHISPRDAGLFDDVEHVSADDPRAHWDGHSTEDKYARIRQHTRQLARRCGSACAEAHTYTGRCEGAHQVDDSDTTTPDVVHPATDPQASNPQQVDEPCPQHPHAPTFDGVCGGCTQYPADMKPATPASEEQRDAQQ
ncbi:hypothetical protein [Streptomyces anthocyanicus]|uniref:hypothetical protein n=1 Tax=Streptomyces anthocyanicus TaxID=68174 RepID=UPI00382F4267